jgi:hypothetical protein
MNQHTVNAVTINTRLFLTKLFLGKELLVGSSFFFCAIFLAVCCKVNILESQNGLKLFGFSIFSPTYKKEEYVCIQQKLRL